MTKTIHVVAAVIYDQQQENILIAKRPDDKHQGGKWEFPGGKVEDKEPVLEALQRELHEELDIQVSESQPLIQIRHQYSDKSVFLDVYDVTAFTGKPMGKEGQEVKWVPKTQLAQYTFPDANVPILSAVLLPDQCLITPEPNDETLFLEQLERVLQTGIRLIQFRAKQLSDDAYLKLAEKVIQQAHQVKAKVLLNSPPAMLETADGLHLTSHQLLVLEQRPALLSQQLLSAACHNEIELKQASRIGVDLAFLSPIKPTASHPGAPGLGWDAFYELSKLANVPVYALGGLASSDFDRARMHGAQGVAAISSIWNAS